MNIQDLIAIDLHTHAEVSCCQPYDEFDRAYDAAASKYLENAIRLLGLGSAN